MLFKNDFFRLITRDFRGKDNHEFLYKLIDDKINESFLAKELDNVGTSVDLIPTYPPSL